MRPLTNHGKLKHIRLKRQQAAGYYCSSTTRRRFGRTRPGALARHVTFRAIRWRGDDRQGLELSARSKSYELRPIMTRRNLRGWEEAGSAQLAGGATWINLS
jgi:hypothetical protein